MNSQNFWKLLAILGLAFGFPWLCLIILPAIAQSEVTAVGYAEEEGVEGGLTAYPDPTQQSHGASDYGRQIYAAEGCAYCHTQVVRPTYAGYDRWREGWGGREGEGVDFVRETRAEDYIKESFAPLGYQRIGQDLSNVGNRIKSAEMMHRHLYEPRVLNPDSGMPAYLHLYKKSPVDGSWVPTGRAEALVDYLLSLKKDQPLPAALSAER